MTLGEVVQPRGIKQSPQDFPADPFLGMDRVEAHTMRVLGFGIAGEMKSSAARFEAEDVLYGRLRPYLNKVVLASVSGLASAEFIVLPPTDAMCSRFLAYRLNARDFVNFASHLNEGDRPRVSFDQIAEFSLSVPHPIEQRAIAAKIEALFNELDAGVAQLETAQALLRRYRQSVLKAAFEGRLTAEWREQRRKEAKANGEKLPTAQDLLKQIEAERQERTEQQHAEWQEAVRAWEAAGGKDSGEKKPRKPTKPKDPPPLTEEELASLPELPEGWDWVWLQTLAEHIVDGTHHTPKYVENGVPFISAKDIMNFSINFSDTRFITEAEHAELIKRCRPRRGSVLITKSGTIGRVAAVDTDAEFSLFESVANVPLFPSVNVRYLRDSVFSTIECGFGAKNQKGVAVRHLHLEDLRRLPVPVPPAQEQQTITSSLDSSLSITDRIEQTLNDAMRQATALRQSILKRAFEGRLLDEAELETVRSDPDYEPAEKLLERIRSQAEASKKTKKPTKKKTTRKKRSARKTQETT